MNQYQSEITQKLKIMGHILLLTSSVCLARQILTLHFCKTEKYIFEDITIKHYFATFILETNYTSLAGKISEFWGMAITFHYL